MRQIILDTETTGLEPELGHRIIEIGCIEVLNRRRTGRVFHRYLRPDREIDPGALQVHGLTAEFLQGQPRFAEIGQPIVAAPGSGEGMADAFDLDFGIAVV